MFAYVLLVVLLIYLLYNFITKPRLENFKDSGQTVSDHSISCIYAYYEKNDMYSNNFRYFLTNGGILPHVNYYIVINGHCSVDIPQAKNIKLLRRENKGYDFGSWGEALKTFPEIFTSDYIIFMNTSVRGPYLNDKDWEKPFIDLFNKPNIGMVGTSINISTQDFSKFSYGRRSTYPHVQSMFFVLKKDSLKFLYDKGIFIVEEDISFDKLIGEHEVGMSIALLNNGWNINSILSKYRDIDYRVIDKDINFSSVNGDPYYPNAYFGDTIQPYEAIIYKNTRFV